MENEKIITMLKNILEAAKDYVDTDIADATHVIGADTLVNATVGQYIRDIVSGDIELRDFMSTDLE